jgi:hypothetical protein
VVAAAVPLNVEPPLRRRGTVRWDEEAQPVLGGFLEALGVCLVARDYVTTRQAVKRRVSVIADDVAQALPSEERECLRCLNQQPAWNVSQTRRYFELYAQAVAEVPNDILKEMASRGATIVRFASVALLLAGIAFSSAGAVLSA